MNTEKIALPPIIDIRKEEFMLRQLDAQWEAKNSLSPIPALLHTPMQDKKLIASTKATAEQMTAIREKFEEMYGVDQKTRTKQQWQNLVNKYGIYNVCRIEKMTIKQVKAKIRNVRHL